MDISKAQELIEVARTNQARATEIQESYKGREATAEELANYDAALTAALDAKAEADALIAAGERKQKATSLDEWLGASAGRLPGLGSGGTHDVTRKATGEDAAPEIRYKAHGKGGAVQTFTPTPRGDFDAGAEAAYTALFRQYLRDGADELSKDDRALIRRKGLSVGTDVAGGFLVAPEVMLNDIIQALEDAVIMRKLGRVLPPLTNATSISAPTASDLSDASWTQELATATADTATPFGKRALRPHPLAKLVKVSDTLVRLSGIDVERWVGDEIINRFAAAEENGFMTGTGNNQPEGVFVSSLPTDVTAASATEIVYNDLSNVAFAIKAQYRPGASWIIHRTILKEISQIKDGEDRPIFGMIPGAGQPLDLLGFPVNVSEYSPSSSATGLYVAALGNWNRAYWIVDSLNFRIQRLVELYAATNEIGFIARKETDGMVVDGNGIARLIMA